MIFRGEVTRIQSIGDDDPASDGDPQLVTLRVSAAWKGDAGDTVTVLAIAHPRYCDGYAFKKGTEYIVYANRSKPGAWRHQRMPMGKTLDIGGMCPRRIRTDVAEEASLLAAGRMSLTGVWTGQFPGPPAEAITFRFQQSGSQLSGAIELANHKWSIREGMVQGDRLLVAFSPADGITEVFVGRIRGTEIEMTSRQEGTRLGETRAPFTLVRAPQ